MDKIQNINDLILKYGKPSNTISGVTSKPFIELPYGLVKIEIPQLLSSEKIEEAINAIIKIQSKDFNIENSNPNEVTAFILWIKEQMEFIANIEKQHLSSEPEPELSASGISRLEEFGVLATIDHLAGGDLLKYKDIEAQPYYKVYQKLKLDKVQGEIKKKYEEIIRNKK